MIRAIALATETSHVIGTVELAPTPAGLGLTFVRASGFAAAYAPTPPMVRRAIVVPWAEITEASDDGEALRIRIDSRAVPHHRLILTHLSRDRGFDHTSVARRRVRGELLVAAGAALAVGVVTPLVGALSGVTAAAVAALTTFSAITAALVHGQAVSRRAILGGPTHALERRYLLEEIQRHRAPREPDAIAWRPAPLAAPSASPHAAASPEPTPGDPPRPRSDRLRWPFGELTPAMGGALVAAVLGMLALSVASRFRSSPPPVPPPTAPAAAVVAERAPTPTEHTLTPTPGDPCVCEVPFAGAIPQGVPRVSLLSSVVRRTSDPKRPSLVVEVAAVNNGKEPARRIAGAVTFLASGRRPGEPDRVIRDRGFFYEGPLAPGAAVKWRISGRGLGFRAATTDETTLAPDELASSDAFAALLTARTRSVRIYGAAMLARARDDRAKGAVDKLREEGEDPRLTSISRATEPVLACDLRVKGSRTSACIANSADTLRGPLRVTLVTTTAADAEAAPLSRVVLAEGLVLAPRAGLHLEVDAAVPEESTDTLRDVVIETERSHE